MWFCWISPDHSRASMQPRVQRAAETGLHEPLEHAVSLRQNIPAASCFVKKRGRRLQKPPPG